MNAVNITVRVDASLKRAADDLFSDLGLSMTAAVTLFLKKAVACDGIPFTIRREKPNAITQVALAEYKDMMAHSEEYKRYSSVDEAFEEALHSA